MEIDPNAVIAALGQQVGALAADNARLRVGLDTAEAELTKVTRERDVATAEPTAYGAGEVI